MFIDAFAVSSVYSKLVTFNRQTSIVSGQTCCLSELNVVSVSTDTLAQVQSDQTDCSRVSTNALTPTPV